LVWRKTDSLSQLIARGKEGEDLIRPADVDGQVSVGDRQAHDFLVGEGGRRMLISAD